jgi:hypothetical protein
MIYIACLIQLDVVVLSAGKTARAIVTILTPLNCPFFCITSGRQYMLAVA